MNVDKVLKLADFLDNLPEKYWDFGKIMACDELYFEETVSHNFQEEPNCGAVGCAVGWAPAAFPDELMWHNNNVQLKSFRLLDSFCMSFASVAEVLDFDGKQMMVFTLGPDYWKGFSYEDITPKMVAEKLRELAEANRKDNVT